MKWLCEKIFNKKTEYRRDLIDSFKFISYPSAILNKEIDSKTVCKIDSIDWSQFLTAYGNAQPLVPKSLKALFSNNHDISFSAARYLLCALGDKDVSFSPATLPAYEFLRKALLECDVLVKRQIISIFSGIVIHTTYTDYEEDKGYFKFDEEYQDKYPLRNFEIALLKNIREDIFIFEKLCLHDDTLISEDSIDICRCLNL